MLTFRKTTALACLLLFGAAGCQDLDIQNPNQPETERVLSRPGDVESLIAGGYSTWYHGWSSNASGVSLRPLLSVMANQHSAWPANFGMVDRSTIPRRPINNNPADAFAQQFERHWYQNYSAISAAVDGLNAMQEGIVPAAEARARSFARFVMGLGYAHLALLFDQAFVLDETTERDPATGMPLDVPQLPYNEVMDIALGHLQEAIDLAAAGGFSIPADWMSVALTNERYIQLLHSYKARFRAGVARNLTERQAVDWNAVIADARAGLTTNFMMNIDDSDWENWSSIYMQFFGWSQMPYWIHGMADQSGRYQQWLALPVGDKHPDLPSGPFIITTPDQRFPQGATLAEQNENPGVYIEHPTGVSGQWGQPGRGTWRWSYYRDWRFDFYLDQGFTGLLPEFLVREVRLLEAEGLYWTGDLAGAAAIVNESRVGVGELSPTDAAGTNADCVPRLPDGTCGGLLEMLKWEKRMEVYMANFASWYTDSRGWGDLMAGSFIHAPIPAKELNAQQLPFYTFGGVDQPGGAPVGNYGF